MKSLTCVICPVGCALDVNDENNAADYLSVSGNRCPRGETFAREEALSPKRTVTATCGIEGESLSTRRLPVKTTSPCPREKIPALLRDIYNLKVSLPVKTGDILIAGWKGERFDIVATRSIG